MTRQLIAESYIGANSPHLVLAKEGSEDVRNYLDNIVSDLALCSKQYFAWRSGYITFSSLAFDLGTFYVELYLSDSISLDPLCPLAIVLPFTKADEDVLTIGGLDTLPFSIPSGNYQILYENRFLEREEWGNYEGVKKLLEVETGFDTPENPHYESYPTLFHLTFIPTIDLEAPQILKDTHGLVKSSEMIW
ncbi:MAG: hypothetical protein HC812_09065 [Leptolyngbya sp. RL_3_1]|nr:hypothetical protein [Leptolyngbya sp. RL_3_1]